MNFTELLKEKVKRQARKTIILPEKSDARVVSAAEQIVNEDLCDILFIDETPVKGAKVINKSEYIDEFANEFYELRKNKGIDKDKARATVSDDTYFATMCVYKGLADGMVSGATHTTADTIRPAFQIIKTKPDVSIVSSCFFMVFEEQVLVFADCAVNPTPTPEQLVEIAASTIESASIVYNKEEIKLAFMSYSTGNSGLGPAVEAVKETVKLFKDKYQDIEADGPLQYDAAVNETVGKQKLPESKVAGKANVLIFPDLNTGNNVYKAVQQTGGILAVGPILQGLKKPVNDLSRGTTVPDVVNTILITALTL